MEADSKLDELVRLASSEADRAATREKLFQLLNDDPTNPRARVLLARTFYDDGFIEFSVRELIEAKKYTESPTLTRLLEAFGDHALRLGYGQSYVAGAALSASPEEKTVAEIEVELEFDSALDKLK